MGVSGLIWYISPLKIWRMSHQLRKKKFDFKKIIV